MSTLLDVRVAAIRELTPVIREYSFEALASTLPGFSAGSHVQLHLPNGRRNAYSLLSDPADTRQYRIAVRQQDASRGGSRYLHQHLKVGDRLRLSPPANLFPLHGEAQKHILVAAGIGITPFLAYSQELLRRGADFELHYAYRAGSSDAYVDELRQQLGPRLHEYLSGQRRLDLASLLQGRTLGTHVYACGPQSLLLGQFRNRPPPRAGARAACTGKPLPRRSPASRSASSWRAVANNWKWRRTKAYWKPWRLPVWRCPTSAGAESAASARRPG